jgi:NDP-sugar pyrophosphorylase family protein
MKKKNQQLHYGVILAAGLGDRIKPLSFFWPKPLLPVGNKPIMQHQIEIMKELGIENFIVVVGHLKDKIIDHFKDGSDIGVRIKYIQQKETLGIAHAVGQLEEYIDKPFMLFLGDIFVIPKNIRMILDKFYKEKANAVLAVRRETNHESIKRNFAVILENDNKVKRVIEKPRYLVSDYKGCGIYLFDLTIFDAIRRTPRTAMRDEYEITTAIQILLDDGCLVYAQDVVNWDMNVTYPSDLLICNDKWLRSKGEANFIDKTSCIHPEAKIIHSSIGKNVKILEPITIKNSVILENSLIKTKKDIIDSLVSRKSIINFNSFNGNV